MHTSTDPRMWNRFGAFHGAVHHVAFWWAISALMLFSAVCCADSPIELSIDYVRNSVVAPLSPRFSWMVPHLQSRGCLQSAYQIMVRSHNLCTASDVWDSGKLVCNQSLLVPYPNILSSGSSYSWRVRIWDNQTASDWSFWQSFSTQLELTDWKSAVFISGGAVLRKAFSRTSSSAICQALLYSSTLGYGEVYLDDQITSPHVLDVGWTRYNRRILYTAHDVTLLLRESQRTSHVLGIMLGNGHYGDNWYSGEKEQATALVMLRILYTDGSEQSICSDSTWHASSDGPVRAASIYGGETYDARREFSWDLDSIAQIPLSWHSATVLPARAFQLRSDSNSLVFHALSAAQSLAEQLGTAELAPQQMPAMEVVTILPARSHRRMSDGSVVFDFGQNLAGWVRLSLPQIAAGVSITIQHAELLFANGSLNRRTLGLAEATDVYITRSAISQQYQPRFTYHGFRYAQVFGLPSHVDVGLQLADACVVHTAVEHHSLLQVDNDLVQRIHEATVWSQRSNLYSLPTDCPQRDERLGWLADAHLTVQECLRNFDATSFYRMWLANMRTELAMNGTMPDFVPNCDPEDGDPITYCDRDYTRPADPAWGTAFVSTLWDLFWRSGDIASLEQHYDAALSYVEMLHSRQDEDGLISWGSFGDWLAVSKVPTAIVSAYYYYKDTMAVAAMAQVLNNDKDAEMLRNRGAAIASSYNAKYFNSSHGYLAPSGLQAAQALPLVAGIACSDQFVAVGRALVDVVTHGDVGANGTRMHPQHLSTGIIGTQALLPALTAIGRSELAWALVTQKTYPSWGYMIEMNATTLWENWQWTDLPTDGASHNHVMFGSVDEWLFAHVAGIQPLAAGYAHVLIRPDITRFTDLSYVSAQHQTPYGRVESSWRRTGDRDVTMTVQIAANTRGNVCVPRFTLPQQISESGNVVWTKDGQFVATDGVVAATADPEAVCFDCLSGLFHFTTD
eukprot:TRINITY_DN12295_c0_g1_i1.p1 TRINITY_DN12295_c0_g1~~TRINITY_DN12295_c0_g1_i1.p1  ORF type:complete len:963 (+),score=144.57 TRINITY_DN12295_c0_g1_i1:120-3008(+)